MNEMEVQLQTAQADLRSAQKRIESLQHALKGQDEEYSSGGEAEEGEEGVHKGRRTKALGGAGRQISDDLDISSDGSYRIGEIDDSASDSDEDDILDHLTHRRQRRQNATTSSRLADDSLEDFTPRKRFQPEVEKEKFTATRRTRKEDDLKDDEEESRKRFDWRSLFSDEEENPVKLHPDLSTRSTRTGAVSEEGDHIPRGRRHQVADEPEGESSRAEKRVKPPSRGTGEEQWNWEDEQVKAKSRRAKLLASSGEEDEPETRYKPQTRQTYKDFLSDDSDLETKPSPGREGRRKPWEANSSEMTKPGKSDATPPLQDTRHKSDNVDKVGEMTMGVEQQEPERARKSSGTDSSQASPLHKTLTEASDISFAASRERRKRRRSRKGSEAIIQKPPGTAM